MSGYSGNDIWNKYVLSSHLNESTDEAVLMLTGSAFHAVGPATVKEYLPLCHIRWVEWSGQLIPCRWFIYSKAPLTSTWQWQYTRWRHCWFSCWKCFRGGCGSLLEPNSNTRTPATNTTNGRAHNKFTTNGQKFATSQHLDMSRCWALALRCGKFVVELLWACPLVVSIAGVRSRCPCSGVWA